jgi:hypothetical protein
MATRPAMRRSGLRSGRLRAFLAPFGDASYRGIGNRVDWIDVGLC